MTYAYDADDDEFTEAELLDALNTFSQLDKMALSDNPSDFIPKWDRYDTDQFYYE